ncbi:MAG: metallophosphoesterase [Chloroflexi bacterium]|nr:metallophosphoesterase [Chloroflexota bacterium]
MNRKRFFTASITVLLGIVITSYFFIVSDKNNVAEQPKTEGVYSSKTSPGLVGSAILGIPTSNSIVINMLAEKGMAALVDYGTKSGSYDLKTNIAKSEQGEPVIIKLNQLKSNTKYFYRVNYKQEKDSNYSMGTEHSFFTQRASGAAFSFGVQGDSHPERSGKMFNSALYLSTMQNVSKAQPDFYFTMGDDFSIENLIEKNQVTQEAVDQVYQYQRSYLDIVGTTSPLFLVNGNHEQAAKYLLNGTSNNPAVLAAKARVNFYPLPVPDSFYGGDSEKVEPVGYLRDYYSFEWGDALFVTIDPYWHSDIAVDNTAGDAKSTEGKKKRDLWGITLGNLQYQWFKQTLENSKAKYKFVFTHHVLGTGRGGVENAKLYEWGGYNQQGAWEFNKMRPGWEMPIHDLMVKNGVTIFFQGHDHLFARQELDGVIYQSVPNPADDTYTAFNQDAYAGDIFPNSGFLNVTVSPEQVKVDYVRSFLAKDETNQNKNGNVAFSYVVKK